MASCGSLDHIFENPLQENPALLESFSPWNQIKSIKHNLDDHSSPYTELFGELHFKEHKNLESSASSSASSSVSPIQETREEWSKKKNYQSPDHNERETSQIGSYYTSRKQYRHSDSFSSMNSESLSLCTEGLGFESSDDVEELKNNDQNCCSFDFQSQSHHDKIEGCWKESTKRLRTNKGQFPPPISCIGRAGKPGVCFKPYREDGRFILQEVRIPTQEFLHACREDGRLRLQLICSDDEILEGDEEEEEYEEDGEEEKDLEISCNNAGG